MLIRDFVSEAIASPPINVGTFVRARLQTFKDAFSQIGEAREELARLEGGEGDRLFRYLAQQAGCNEDEVEYRIRTLGREISSSLEALIYSLESYISHGGRFLGYAVNNALELEIPADWNANVAALKRVPAGAIAYGFEAPEDRALPEFLSYQAIYDAHLKGAEAISRVYADCARFIIKMSALNDRINGQRTGSDWKPAHGEVETLYHASAFASEIASDGFHDIRPTERRGLGIYGTQKGLSMTHSLNIAAQINRCLKEVWMIVHGQLTAKQIRKWIEAEKLQDQISSTLSSQRLIPGVESTLILYNAYLWMTKLRQNPVFTHIELIGEVMKTRSVADIGVLSCQVKLTGEEEYKPHECEFVVDPTNVQSVKRLF